MFDKNTFHTIHDDKQGSVVWYTSKQLDEAYGFKLVDAINNASVQPDKQSYAPVYTENLRNQIPENFCLYPFTHFQLDPDGRARPCCKYKVGDASWQKDVPKLPDVNLGDLWEQQEFQQLRHQFLNNEKPSGCKACWDEEAAGIKSMRLQREEGGKEHPYATFYHHIPRKFPKTLDFKLSNLCNLKCRICTPFLSSQWMKEIKDLQINDMGSYDTFVSNSREKFSENPKNIEILQKWAPTVDFMEFYGGEPLMQQEHDKILAVMYEFGNSKNTGLYYNTNGTICNEEFFKIWAQFKEVTINFSIDDIESRFEYQRKNAKWESVLENIKLYKEFATKYNVNLKMRFYTTIGILNVFYLKEFLDYIKDFDMKVLFNMVHYPHHYSIVNLPDEVKNIVKEKLLSIDTSILDPWSPTIENIINFMYGSAPNHTLLELFFQKTKMHDSYRNESFIGIFPELAKLLNYT